MIHLIGSDEGDVGRTTYRSVRRVKEQTKTIAVKGYGQPWAAGIMEGNAVLCVLPAAAMGKAVSCGWGWSGYRLR